MENKTINMNENNTEIKVKNEQKTTETKWVIGPGGVKMEYKEWLDMVMSERD